MSHATDGDLHAHLDGALASGDPVRAERLAAHLDGCPDCRVRLEEARALRTRAGEILAEAETEPVRPPPFEEILRRAGTAERSPASSAPIRSEPVRRPVGWSGPPLAWAASVAIALGAGWLGHAVWAGSPVSDFTMRAAEEMGATDPAAPEDLESSLIDGLQEGAAAAAGDARDLEEQSPADVALGFGDRVANLKPEQEAEAPAREDTRGRGVRQDLPADTRRPAAAPPGAEPAPPRGAEANEVSSALRKQVAEDSALERRVSDPDELLQEPRALASVSRDALVEPGVSGQAVRLDAGVSAAEVIWLPVSRNDAEEWMAGTLLLVPGLDVSDVAISAVGGARFARVRQRLSSGGRLELIQRAITGDEVGELMAATGRGAGADRRVFATEGREQVVTLSVDRDGFRITAIAPVAIDSLRILLSRVR